jgi:hypothetical protein
VLPRIQQIRGEQLVPQQGSLYPALYRLEHERAIKRVGRKREQPQGHVLHAYYVRAKAASRRNGKKEPHGGPHRRHPAAHGFGGTVVSARLVKLKSWLRSAFGRSRLETDMEEEIQFHLVARAADLMREGLNAREATRQARLEFGTVAAAKDEMRHSLGLRWWDELWSDLRYATRILRKSPGFTAIAVGSLALAIGANTTIFSVANELLYERLGVPHPEQLRLLEEIGDEHVAIHSFWGGGSGLPDGRRRFDTFTYPVYLQLKKQNQVLGDIFAFKELDKVNATVDGSAQAVSMGLVSGNFYQQLGVRPALGRRILPSDDQAPGTGAVVMISDGFWTRYFGRSPRVIGKVITVNLAPVTIIGVNPRGSPAQRACRVRLNSSCQCR